MNRRGFLKVATAAVAAPYVITTPGLLMPVKKLWTPPETTILDIEGIVGQHVFIGNTGSGYISFGAKFLDETFSSLKLAAGESVNLVYNGSKWMELGRTRHEIVPVSPYTEKTFYKL